MKLISTVLSVAVHYDNQNPVFGEGRTLVEVDDESGGAFIKLSQEDVTLRFDIEELERILEVAKDLVKSYPIDK